MKKIFLLLSIFLLFISCTEIKETEKSDKSLGRFTHQIPNCKVGENPEINCIEFIDFVSKTDVDVLIGGGDKVIRTTYFISGNKIDLVSVPGLNFNISFEMKSSTTLMRIEDEEIWIKSY